MKIRQVVFTGLVLGLAAAAFAGDETKMKMSVVVIDDTADGEIRIELDSDDLDFDLQMLTAKRLTCRYLMAGIIAGCGLVTTAKAWTES